MEEGADMNMHVSEVTILRERIAHLEEELRQLKEDIKPSRNPFIGRLGLTLQLAEIVHALHRSDKCSQALLDRVTEASGHGERGTDDGLVCNRTKVALSKIRKCLSPYGVKVRTIWGFGYAMSDEDKRKLTAILKHTNV